MSGSGKHFPSRRLYIQLVTAPNGRNQTANPESFAGRPTLRPSSLVTGHWSLVTSHWPLATQKKSSVKQTTSGMFCGRFCFVRYFCARRAFAVKRLLRVPGLFPGCWSGVELLVQRGRFSPVTGSFPAALLPVLVNHRHRCRLQS